MKLRVKLGSGISVDTDLGTVQGDSVASKQFSRSFPSFGSMSLDDFKTSFSAKGWLWEIETDASVSSEEPAEASEPEPEPKKKKKGIFSKSNDGEKNAGD